jgi:hypothetical protein
MHGQWIGRYAGINSGLLVADFDRMGTHHEGRAFAYDDNPALPWHGRLYQNSGQSETF